MYEAIGPEPVSPHYESFAMSRRVPILGAAFLTVAGYLEQLNLNSFYGKQAVYEVYTLFILMIGLNESRYWINRLPLPRMTWYYQAFHEHEIRQTFLNAYDSAEEKINNFLSHTKEQIDYYLIHKEFTYVKKRVLATFLENERQGLNRHFQERTINLLNNIKQLENNNIKQEINTVAEGALKTVLNKVNDASQNQAILENAFESALEGLRKGVMTYDNDKIFPMFVEEIQRVSEPLKRLSAEEEDKRYSLSKDQKQYLIELDNRAKKDFLGQAPDVTGSIKNTEVYKNIVQRIKSRVENL